MRGWGGGGEGKNDHAGRTSVTEHNQSIPWMMSQRRWFICSSGWRTCHFVGFVIRWFNLVLWMMSERRLFICYPGWRTCHFVGFVMRWLSLVLLVMSQSRSFICSSGIDILTSRHATLRHRRINIDATLWSCIDVDARLYKCHDLAGSGAKINH